MFAKNGPKVPKESNVIRQNAQKDQWYDLIYYIIETGFSSSDELILTPVSRLNLSKSCLCF
jgi:hypothetical protein